GPHRRRPGPTLLHRLRRLRLLPPGPRVGRLRRRRRGHAPRRRPRHPPPWRAHPRALARRRAGRAGAALHRRRSPRRPLRLPLRPHRRRLLRLLAHAVPLGDVARHHRPARPLRRLVRQVLRRLPAADQPDRRRAHRIAHRRLLHPRPPRRPARRRRRLLRRVGRRLRRRPPPRARAPVATRHPLRRRARRPRRLRRAALRSPRRPRRRPRRARRRLVAALRPREPPRAAPVAARRLVHRSRRHRARRRPPRRRRRHGAARPVGRHLRARLFAGSIRRQPHADAAAVGVAAGVLLNDAHPRLFGATLAVLSLALALLAIAAARPVVATIAVALTALGLGAVAVSVAHPEHRLIGIFAVWSAVYLGSIAWDILRRGAAASALRLAVFSAAGLFFALLAELQTADDEWLLRAALLAAVGAVDL